MSRRKEKIYLSVADYLAGERESEVRHEYVDGQVYAMAGASDRHNRIAGNVYARLVAHLGDGPCEPFISDMKVMVEPSAYYYPDVVVTCDRPAGDPYFRTRPVLVVEVTSPTTERVDRHEKMAAYKAAGSLQEYVLVSQDRMLVEVHRRAGDVWEAETLTEPEAPVRLASVGLTLSVGDVYRSVRLPDEDAA